MSNDLATLVPAFAVFAFVASITPGPNNTMLLSAGLNFGFMRTLPHLAGVTLGFGFMVLWVGLGIGALLRLVPSLYTVMQVAGVLYLLYLAFKIARGGAVGAARGAAPMTFLQAAAFQWINPKGWIMAVSAVSSYPFSNNVLGNAALTAVLFIAMNAPAVVIWAACGSSLRRVLANPRVLHYFNLVMATLLVISLYPVVRELAGL